MFLLHVHPQLTSPWVLDALGRCGAEGIRVQSIARASTALARVAGGGVDAILLDGSGGRTAAFEEALLLLRREAGRLPLLLALGEGEALDGQEAAITEATAGGLVSLIAGGAQAMPAVGAEREDNLVAVLGVKGGVGTTTVALNVAAAMAETRRVTLVELRPDFGVLAGRLRGRGRRSGLEALLPYPPGAATEMAVERLLWPVEHCERLRILSAPQVQPHALTAAHASAVLRAACRKADIVVADLSWDVREAARTAARMAAQVVLVSERTPVSLSAVRAVRGEILTWGVSRDALSLAVVNRAAVGSPAPVERLEEELELRLLDVLPPDPDGCCLCERLRQTTIGLQPEGLMSDKYRAMARDLASQFPPPVPAPGSVAARELVPR
ncbi:MAG: hypothetical protein IPJ98_16940 [Bryobacterales bacterium]|nr:hypothetical protein [Bryobacterales bacterium]